MSAESKRRWFQIHLSTAIVLMFVAGGLLRANVTISTPLFEGKIPMEYLACQGWPHMFHIWGIRGEATLLDDWFFKEVGTDLAVALALLAAVAFVCEAFFRRREARKP